MSSRLQGSRASLLTILLVSILALPAGAARATYTGVQDAATLGTVAAGADWLVVPQYEDNSDPGLIDGTPFNNTSSSLEVSRVSGPRHISFRSVSARYSLTRGSMLVAGAQNVLAVAWTDAAGRCHPLRRIKPRGHREREAGVALGFDPSVEWVQSVSMLTCDASRKDRHGRA
jgi:hypothetical protein